MIHAKCVIEGCIYMRHSDLLNNDGTYCCNGCKLNNGHGKNCERLEFDNKGVELYITNWYERLGNNIHQLHNCILIGLYYNCNIRFPSHNFFTKTYIQLHNLPVYHTITDPSNFFYKKNIDNIDEILFSKNNERALDILRDCFVIKGDSIPALGDNDVVIHIRSGDIFTTFIQELYWQPPLSFYVNLLNKRKFTNVYLLSEDNANPCVDILLELFPNIQYKQNTLEGDIKIILAAKTIISSHGTFVNELVKMSKNIQRIRRYSNKTYIEFMTPWKNTEEQRHIMLTFDETKPNNGLEVDIL